MRVFLIFVLLPLLSVPATANRPEINVDAGYQTDRACYFDGSRYSEGSKIKDDGGTIRCGVLDGVTENGALGWLHDGDMTEPYIDKRQDDTSRVIEIRK